MNKVILISIGSFILIVLTGIYFVARSEQKQAGSNVSIASYSTNNTQRPKVSVNKTIADLAIMKVNEEKKAEFIIENKGDKPLQLFDASSSCGCTVGVITINGEKSPEFGMHSKLNWTGTLEPGQSATVDVIYRPYVMPVKGPVTRDVFMSTNDPENSKLTFT